MTLELFATSAFGATDGPPRCGDVEVWAERQGLGDLVGLDEAGRGPLAGPVVAAAVALPRPSPVEGLDDSKRLTERRRKALFEQVREHALGFAVAVVDPDEIDRLNILGASLEAMRRAWSEVVGDRPALERALVLVDGNQRVALPDGVDQRTLVKGDRRSTNIAAASILAKVTRDRLMLLAHERWPLYGFDRHKGYPTAAHRAAIARLGPCPIHRRSFRLLPGAGPTC